MVYTGKDSYIFWCRESAWKNAGLGIDNADVHIPFNPMENIPEPRPLYENILIRTCDSPRPSIAYTKLLNIGEGSYDGIYIDPFLELTYYTHKTCGGDWVAGTGVITGDFSVMDDLDTIMAQNHKHGQGSSPDIESSLLGGTVGGVELYCNKGELVRQTISPKFANIIPNSQIMICDPNFHDESFYASGGWANWAFKGKSNRGYHSTDVRVTWGDNGISGVARDGFNFRTSYDIEQHHTSESRIASHKWRLNEENECEIRGLMVSDTELAQIEMLYANKTKDTLKIILDRTVGLEKYRQATEMFIESMSSYEITPAAEAFNVSVTFKGGVGSTASLSEKHLSRPSPCSKITT